MIYRLVDNLCIKSSVMSISFFVSESIHWLELRELATASKHVGWKLDKELYISKIEFQKCDLSSVSSYKEKLRERCLIQQK